MRLDKFLKNSRLIKRRTLAKEVCEKGRIFLNGRVAKSSSKVSVGDELTIHFSQKTLTVKVENIFDSTKKEDAEKMYAVIEESSVSPDD